MRYAKLSLLPALAVSAVVGFSASSAFAADKPAGEKPAAAGKPASAGKPDKKLGQYSGFEGREAALGKALVEPIKSADPKDDATHDFTGREEALGFATSTVIKTLNHNSGYQHEMNDALVKMTLTHIQFAKNKNLLKEAVTEDVEQQKIQLLRVKRLMEKTGNKDLAIVAIFEQTTCFFQLVDRTKRAPNTITYKSPYNVVLEQTVRMGIQDLTEKEIHENWTIPRMKAYADILGVKIDVSPWQDDGMITITAS